MRSVALDRGSRTPELDLVAGRIIALDFDEEALRPYFPLGAPDRD